MNAKILFMLLTLTFAVLKVNGQAHDNSRGGCKLFKNHVSTGYTCPACDAKDKKEQAAKEVEDKRRSDALIAKAEAAAKVREIARKKEQAEREANNKVTEVFVTMSKVTVAKGSDPIKKGAIISGDKAILKREYKKFVNEKDEVLFENDDWNTTYSIQDVSMTKNTLKNFGIVDIKPNGKGNKLGEFRADVVNSKGEYLFNDENIKFVCHINDGWLLIGSYNSRNYYVYNLLTKEKIDFVSISKYDSEFGNLVWGPAIDFFLPIFSDKVELNDIYSYQLKGKFTESVLLKKYLSALFPTTINEEFLSKQSFVFVHTNTIATYLAQDSYYMFKINYDGTDTVMLYCVSKNGKFSTIKLK